VLVNNPDERSDIGISKILNIDMANPQKQILFIGATHGDEPIGVEVLKNIEKENNNFDWIIGNEKALERGVRCFEGDLNRSAPGDAQGKTFEQRRAAEIIELFKNYKYTIDIHGTVKNTGIFIILNKLTKQNLLLASLLNISRVVYWPAISSELTGPLTAYTPCGLEIECGEKNNPKIKLELEEILRDYLKNYKTREEKNWEKKLKGKQIFEVYGSLEKQGKNNKSILKEFQPSIIGDETFYPLLIDSYENKICYKMKKITTDQVLLLS